MLQKSYAEGMRALYLYAASFRDQVIEADAAGEGDGEKAKLAERVNDPFFTFFTDDSPPEAHLVAELDGRLAGYIRVKPASPLRENAHVLGIVGLAVAPGDRRRGDASALLAAAEQHARDRGARDFQRAKHTISISASACFRLRDLIHSTRNISCA